MKKILHLCADTGSDSMPYKLAGYEVILIGSDIGVENYTPLMMCTGYLLIRYVLSLVPPVVTGRRVTQKQVCF